MEPEFSDSLGEGGREASRFKNIVRWESGYYRRFVSDELDILQGFPKEWTDAGMLDGGANVLAVGVSHPIAEVITGNAL